MILQRSRPRLAPLAMLLLVVPTARADEPDALRRFRDQIRPILEDRCFDCHGMGQHKGKVAFDGFATDEDLLRDRDLWFRVLKNVRAGLMPPADHPRPDADELKALASWIKYGALAIDPNDPDPGRVTLRRLNRAEYRNTIRDLMGIDFRTDEEFPPDDTGYGFDNIGDVLTVSPLLLEKYLDAAQVIAAEAVPTVTKVVRESTIVASRPQRPGSREDPNRLSFLEEGKVGHPFTLDQAGDYRLVVELDVHGGFDFIAGRCEATLTLDGKPLDIREYGWVDHKRYPLTFETSLEAGKHAIELALKPLEKPQKTPKVPIVLALNKVTVQGPLAKEKWVHPPNYERFFPRDEPPAAGPERDRYAREVLCRFVRKAFRRPVDEKSIDRLARIAAEVYEQPGRSFEEGVARALIPVLASPRFLFRIEAGMPIPPDARSAPVDDHALASRLSYFLWSSMPDDELFGLADRGELRSNLAAQVQRMMADDRADALIRDFVGQWLQVRDIEGVSIDGRAVARRDGRATGFGFGPQFDRDLRLAMRHESEMTFARVVREDRSVVELIESDWTYLNERLAKHYGIDDVKGEEMRLVQLPEGSPRGGILTQGSILAVTSNPTRTSPVKRGLFLLDNILGTPPPPPPAEVPPLEESEKAVKDHDPTLREALQLHRNKPLCQSCHNRMDPLGLALENFNAMGQYREKERKQPIDPAGKLITGEEFKDVRELKHLLADNHRVDFERCLTEKLLTYALGRGLEAYDVEAVDRIVDRLDREHGKFSALLMGVIESAPFQRRRVGPAPAADPGARPARRAESEVGSQP
ncbi:MAG TPA: DUF1592 domain-containing protein [Isosphaeraceae bacterium]|jgi:hypothetical protein|nr:DUF1592 domain-containing protein [Isosphaeraceae bacterium]